jgi:hypothetical protein
MRNSLLESMLIHVRALLDFFERRKRRKDRSGAEYDDVLSSDFGYPPSPVALPADCGSRINKEIAHLSYARAKRLTKKDKEWDPAAFLPLVIRCIEFIDTRSEEEIRELEQFRAQNRMEPLPVDQLRAGLSALRITFEAEQQRRSTVAGL